MEICLPTYRYKRYIGNNFFIHKFFFFFLEEFIKCIDILIILLPYRPNMWSCRSDNQWHVT